MTITFEELRRIKHSLPHGSVARIAGELNKDEREVRSFFGGMPYEPVPNDFHFESGPNGGVVSIRDTSILDTAYRILNEFSQRFK